MLRSNDDSRFRNLAEEMPDDLMNMDDMEEEPEPQKEGEND